MDSLDYKCFWKCGTKNTFIQALRSQGVDGSMF